MLGTIVEVLVYAALGTVLMGLASLVFDLIVPYDFQGDIAQGNVLVTCLWSGIALALFVAAYFLLDIVLFRKIDFNDEIRHGNEAVGIVVFGILVGIAFVMSGVVM